NSVQFGHVKRASCCVCVWQRCCENVEGMKGALDCTASGGILTLASAPGAKAEGKEERRGEERHLDLKRKTSPVWEHFEMISSSKVRCLVCDKELLYSINPVHTQGQMIDEALVNMIIKDSQPFSPVEDEGFRGLIHALDRTYVLPSRQALKKMVDSKYEEAKIKAKAEMENVKAVSLTSDMWTSLNMDAYLAITCHYIDENDKLNTVLLGVEKYPDNHTAENIDLVKNKYMEEWEIKEKVKCLVTDAAANMIACAKILQVRHTIYIAHALNLMVKKSFDQVSALCDIRTKAKKIVTYFRSSTIAKEKLNQMQQDMRRPALKLINEVETRWNSTIRMLQRLYGERQAVGASLASLRTDTSPLYPQEYEVIEEVLRVLSPFQQATVELSEEKRVSGSKVIQLMKMIHHSLQGEQISHSLLNQSDRYRLNPAHLNEQIRETGEKNDIEAQAITIQVQKEAVTAPVQGSVFFSVDIKCIGIPTIGWMFSGTSKQQRIAAWTPGGSVNITQLYKGRVTAYPNGSLTISHLQLQDSGYHIITVTEPSGNSKDAGVLLNVTEVLYEDIQYLVVFVIVLGALAAFLMLCIWLLNKLYCYIKAWNLRRHLPEHNETELQPL
ncbi:putative zinc finger BED domain-containing protein 1-like, partial [Triplophysa rosa]